MEITLYAMSKKEGKSATHFQFKSFDKKDLELNGSKEDAIQVIVPRGSEVIGDKLIRKADQDGRGNLSAQEVHSLAREKIGGFHFRDDGTK